MNYALERQLTVAHLLRLRSVDPVYARWALPKYALMHHLFETGFEEEVKEAWAQKHPEAPSW